MRWGTFWKLPLRSLQGVLIFPDLGTTMAQLTLIFPDLGCTKSMDKIPCSRCTGKGEIPAFKHVKAGVCFRCWGTGHDLPAERRILEGRLNLAREDYRHLFRAWKGARPGKKAEAGKRLEACTKAGKALAKELARLDAEIAVLAAKSREAA